jgi:hypothetical protein
MPVILAIWEDEIRRTVVQGKKKFARPHLNGKKLGKVV